MPIPPPDDRLFLHEEVLLLSLNDEKGTNERGAMPLFALGGSILAELLLHDRVRVGEDRKKLLSAISPRLIGEPYLDQALELVRNAKRPGSAVAWIQRFSRIKGARSASLERLCDRGILKAEHHRVLGIFPRTVFPEVDPGPERDLRTRIDHAVRERHADVDERTAILIAVATSTNLLRATFGKDWFKAHKKRIESIEEHLESGQATRAAIEALQATIAATQAAAAMVAITSAT